jgi:hypothetical protein
MAIVKCFQLPSLYDTSDSTCKLSFPPELNNGADPNVDATADLVIWTRYPVSFPDIIPSVSESSRVRFLLASNQTS